MYDLVVDELCLNPPVKLTIAQVESAIDRLYAFKHFGRIGYQYHANEEGGKLTLRFAEKIPQSFQFGIHYDREQAISLLLNTALYNVIGTRSSVLVDLRIGRNLSLEANYFTHFGFIPQTGFHFRGNVQRSFLGIYENGQRLGELQQRSLSLETFWGTYYSRSTLIAVGMKTDWANLKPHTISKRLEQQSNMSFIPALKLLLDTSDRTIYPRRGIVLEGESEHFKLLSGSSGYAIEFTRYRVDLKALLPIGSKLSALVRAQAGKTSAGSVPLNHQFHLGGFDSFAGYHPQELRGTQMQDSFMAAWSQSQSVFTSAPLNKSPSSIFSR